MRIAVYCSAAENLPEKWRDNARAIGEWLGRSGAELVYGGVEAGLMKVVSDAALGKGARTVGVVPARRLNMASPHIDVAIRTSDLSERKRIMLNISDAFLALPGGIGTLDEIASTLAHLSFTGRKTPVIICNTDGVFSSLIDLFNSFVSNGLMRDNALDNLHVAEDAADAIRILESLNSTTEI